MQRILAIARLTWKAAFRFRLFIVLAVLLLGAVVALPLVLKDDGTARGFTQILLTYTLTTISALLGLSTLWLACGTLARDIEEAQMQMVVTKPIARWQVWLGKWLGLVTLNAALLALTGASVFLLLHWRARGLPPAEQAILRNEVLVARGVVSPVYSKAAMQQAITEEFKARLTTNQVANADVKETLRLIEGRVQAEITEAQPGQTRAWTNQMGLASRFLRDQPLTVRIKFNAAQESPSKTFSGILQVGVPTPDREPWQSPPLSVAKDTFHEFQVPPGHLEADGSLVVLFYNANPVTLSFPMEDGVAVLYTEGGFLMNFIRGLAIILCWMALLAALGLMTASFLSFPVAAFVSLALLALAFSTDTMSSVVEEGSLFGYDPEHGNYGQNPLNSVAVPIFSGLLTIINLAKDFSPVDALSVGRAITWPELGRAILQIVVLLGGLLAIFGIWGFDRRELATAQGTQ
jgi:ABC-type transport system involved in multi-copper enzyme maturation permease subunit